MGTRMRSRTRAERLASAKRPGTLHEPNSDLFSSVKARSYRRVTRGVGAATLEADGDRNGLDGMVLPDPLCR